MPQKPDRPMTMEVHREAPGAVVCVHGSVGMNEAEQMRSQLDELTARQVSPIVLDLADMDFICSVGLGAMISGYLGSRTYNGRFLLVNPQPAIENLFNTTRLTELFAIFPSVEQALAS